MTAPVVSFVIPTLNEAENIAGLISDLQNCAFAHETIVADGGSSDATADVARKCGALIVESAPGRARQMNAGAAHANGVTLCFLHADIRLDQTARHALEHAVTHQDTVVAVWRLRIDGAHPLFRVVELGARLRDSWLGLPYGDQGLLVRRAEFHAVGGYPDLPIMEDVALVRALGVRYRIRRMNANILVSPRRWRRRGIIRQTLRNTALMTAYLAGVSPHRLARFYPIR